MTKMLTAHHGLVELCDALMPIGPQRMALSVSVLDIANALSKMNRFNGHTSRLYSVAEHSLHVVTVMERDLHIHDPEALLCGLLHDAHEAYSADMATPVFEALGERGQVAWRHFTRGVERAVLMRFGLVEAMERHAAAVKQADLIMLSTELRDLFEHGSAHAPCAASWEVHLSSVQGEWQEWRDLFGERFAELQAGREIAQAEARLMRESQSPGGLDDLEAGFELNAAATSPGAAA